MSKNPQEWTIDDSSAYMHFVRRTGEKVKITASAKDVSWLRLLRWGIDGKGRAYTIWLTGKYYAMHRIIMNIRGHEQVDHINNDPLDNRRENLRLCMHKQNLKNKLPNRNATVPFKGVGVEKNLISKPYVARICCDGKQKHLGRYATAEMAAEAYDKAATEMHGEFALTNKDLGLI